MPLQAQVILACGILLILGLVLSLVRVDQYWTPQRQRCSKCHRVAWSMDKFCERCGAVKKRTRYGIEESDDGGDE